MAKSENPDDMSDKIKLFNSDESLKLLGELLSNKSSRDIIGLLTEKERYKNEIATKLNLRLNLVSHHLEKMEAIGLVETSYKKIVRKGEDHKFFRVNPKIFIIPNHSEKEIKEKGILKRVFKDGIKFAGIGIIGIITWALSKTIKPIEDGIIYYEFSEETSFFEGLDFYQYLPIITSHIVVIFLTYFLIKKRKGN